MTLRESLAYQPQELNFGTSGLRGLETDMTDLECYINTRGFLLFLETEHSLSQNSTIAIAGDLRRSTPRILKAVTKAIQDSGHTVEYCGLIPTPALAYHSLKENIASIMVTGSHIPADRNGIKFYRADSEVMKEDEVAIKSSVAIIRQEIYSQDITSSPFDNSGNLKISPDLPVENKEVLHNFLERYTSVFPSNTFEGKHVVVYQHSAVGRDFLVTLLERLGATVTPVQRSETFISIDTENVTPDDQKNFKQIAADYPDNFAIISTDGDSDRPFVIDETGTFHRGDVLGAVVAIELHSQATSLPISASDAVDTVLEKNNISVTHTKIGSPYVIQQMDAQANQRISTGWEVNGGFMTSSDIPYKNGTLTKLPTRDAFLPILIALNIAIDKDISLSQVFSSLPPRYTQAGLLDNFPQEDSQSILKLLSNPETAPDIIAENFTPELGFDEYSTTDTTDGVRLSFANGDVIHIRPSGNAPQLRVYSIANSQERANVIVQSAIKEDGLLVKLQRVTA